MKMTGHFCKISGNVISLQGVILHSFARKTESHATYKIRKFSSTLQKEMNRSFALSSQNVHFSICLTSTCFRRIEACQLVYNAN